jgi:hypothetical protein
MQQTYKFLFVGDVMEILGISKSKVYEIIRKMNKELEAEGYETIAGRVPRRRFCEKFYCGEDITAKKPARSFPRHDAHHLRRHYCPHRVHHVRQAHLPSRFTRRRNVPPALRHRTPVLRMEAASMVPPRETETENQEKGDL